MHLLIGYIYMSVGAVRGCLDKICPQHGENLFIYLIDCVICKFQPWSSGMHLFPWPNHLAPAALLWQGQLKEDATSGQNCGMDYLYH